jgi:hypothetical protein
MNTQTASCSSSGEAVTPPPLSVVVIAPGGVDTVREVVQGLNGQERVAGIEAVLAHPAGIPFPVEDFRTDPFLALRTYAYRPGRSRAVIKTECLPLTSSPVVAFLEDHVRPTPGWARALIDAHAEGWAAVGYAVDNANPESLLSWANLYMTYGPYIRAGSSEAKTLSAENVSYKKDLIVQVGQVLASLMEHEYFLHEVLRSQGHRLYVSSQALIYHRNKATVFATATESFSVGKNFARSRSMGWPVWKRMAYAGGSVLLPAIKGRRILRQINESGYNRLLPGLLPPLAYALTVNAFAEMWAYLFGSLLAPPKR